MLVTTCKHCSSRFRVTPEQLNLRQGQVRCGQCGQVFNGFEALERFPGDDTGARLLAARAAAGTRADPAGGMAGVDLGTRLRPPSPPDRAAPARIFEPEEPEVSPFPPAAPELTDIRDLPDVPDLLLESETATAAPLAVPEARAAPEAQAAAEAQPPEPALSLDAYEPEPPARPSRAWSFGVVFLGLVLAVQLVYAFRSQIAQQYPVLRPILEAACANAGCTVPWVNSESALKLEDSELLEVPGKPGQIALQARIRNLSSSAQEFPHLELTLTDLTGQTAVRRVLRPADYLGRTPTQGEVMAPGSEALLSVRIETKNIRPTGYELLLFYP